MNVNRTGYLKGSKTAKNDYNIIPGSNITTTGMKFPIFANGKLLMPDTGDYKFNTNTVLETPAFYKGGQMRKPKGLKKYSRDELKLQGGGSVSDDMSTTMDLLPQGANVATTLLAPRGHYQGTGLPEMNLANVGNSTLAGGQLGMKIGGPLGAGIGAGVAGGADLVKELVDFNKNKKEFSTNLNQARAENRLDYDRTHKPYGTRGYMQGNPNEQVYSLYEGGVLPDNRKRAFVNVIANDSSTHGSVSLSKQDGGQVPSDLNELFDRAMEESGGDEEKAEALVNQYQEHPEMIQNKGRKKPQLKKKRNA